MKNNLSKGLPLLDFGDDDCMLPKLDKTKRYEHETIAMWNLFADCELTNKLNDGWEILRADRINSGIMYIIRREVA